MVAHGHRTLSLTYHSPSLQPGNTPYVRTADDLHGFLDNLETVLTHFRDTLGGRFTTPTEVHRRMSARAALAA
jgi:hypothetical protein